MCGQVPIKRNFLFPWLGSGTDIWEGCSFGFLGDDFNGLCLELTLLFGHHQIPRWPQRYKQVPTQIVSCAWVRVA